MGWYEKIVSNSQPVQQPQGYSGMTFQNPMQKANYIMQAMQNPAAFVQKVFPNMPSNIANNPNQILMYMKQNCGLTDADIQAAAAQIPKGW